MQFQITRGGAGRSSWRSVPTYDIADWRPVKNDGQVIAYRPSLRTLWTRVLWTIFFLVFLVPLAYGFTADWRLPVQWPAIRWIHIALTGLFGLGAVVAPLSCLWNVVRISVNPRGELEVFRWGLVPRTRRWPLDAFSQMTIDAGEVYERSRYAEVYRGWRWKVRLVEKAAPTGDRARDFALSQMNWAIEFWVALEKGVPTVGEMPGRVREFVEGIRAMSGLAYGRPDVQESTRGRRGLVRTQRSFEATEEPVSRTTYTSLEEMPPDLRARVEELTKSGGSHTVEVSQTTTHYEPQGHGERNVRRSESIRYRDSEGRVHTYNSIDEMPPHLRELYEKMRQQQR